MRIVGTGAFFRSRVSPFNSVAATMVFSCAAYGAPDLVTQNLARSPTSGIAGTVVNVTGTIRNQGTATANASNANLRLSTSSTTHPTSSDPLLTSISVPSLVVNGTFAINVNVTIPAATPVSTRYIWVILDTGSTAGQGSANETNDWANVSFTIASPAGFSLTFPLAGQTHLSASINSVFDHSMASSYSKDDVVVAYTGERGEKLFGWDGDVNHPGLKNATGSAFVINGNYTGGGAPTYLNYDGHPGIDYRAQSETPIYATADGVVHYPSAIPGLANASAYHTLAIDHGNGYITYYLHCLTHPATGNALVAEGEPILRNDLVAYSGEAGSPGAPHLHVEVHFQGVPVDPYGWDGDGADPYVAAVSVDLWSPDSLGTKPSGIDVSHHQGTINWTQVAAAGKTFAFVKATEGVTFADEKFVENATNATAANILVGAYHFATPVDNPAVAEAQYFVSIAGPYIANGYLPPTLDLEWPGPGTGYADPESLGWTTLSTWVQDWMDEVERLTGVRGIIYCTRHYAANLAPGLNVYPLWVATNMLDPDFEPDTGVWATWTFQQYDWTGSVPGVNGGAPPVDLDSFNGDLVALQALTDHGPGNPNLVACDPTHCTVDARISHDPLNQGVLYNTDLLTLLFDGATSGMSSADFDVIIDPPGGIVPTIADVSTGGQAATITLNRRIATGTWTCIRHVGSNSQCCIGSLPGDADWNRVAQPADLFELFDNLAAFIDPPLGIERCDIDRSGICTPADLLMNVDLLNGSSAFNPTLGDTLPVCPVTSP